MVGRCSSGKTSSSLNGRILLCSELLGEVASSVEKHLMEWVLGTSSKIILMLATSFALSGKTSTGMGSAFAIGVGSVSGLELEFDLSELISDIVITSSVSGAGSEIELRCGTILGGLLSAG